jgi:hypothetical protein
VVVTTDALVNRIKKNDGRGVGLLGNTLEKEKWQLKRDKFKK